ncbi:MAG: arylsulfatase [Bacteroidota bacterium]|nr:arylsulfatase [Bacteroidota bacterium]
MRLFIYILIVLVQFSELSAQRKPNIIFILADDLGYGDIEPYGQSIIKTPRLATLAQQGMKFNRAYCGNTVCAPSRCALMTGKHMGHAYIRSNDPSDKLPPGQGIALRDKDTTLAEVLKTAGYKTGMFGKWGLGVEGTSGSPEKQGWDSFYGYLNQVHAHHHFTDSLWRVKDGTLFPERISAAAFTEDLIVFESKKFIRENKQRPFFLYLSTGLPHAELLIPKKYMNQYTDKSGQSIFLETEFDPKGNGSYHAQPMPKAAYASMVSKLDADVGSIVDLLVDLRIDSNTIIMFASDNGVHVEGGNDPQFFNSTAGLRGVKRDLYEGGIRSPFIVWGPGRVKPNSISNVPISFWDVMPTLATLSGTIVLPKNDGTSFHQILKNDQARLPERAFYWENYIVWSKLFNQAVMVGNWKLVRTKLPGKPALIELFDIENDVSESTNLAEKNTEKVEQLKNIMEQMSEKPECPDFVYWKEIVNN